MEQGHISLKEIGTIGIGLLNPEMEAFFGVPLVLVVLNWGLEAKKWQLLAKPLMSLSLVQAVRAVLTGLSLGFITSQSIGDYAGRILEAPGKKRESLVGAVMLSSLSQSFITNLAGLAGLVLIFYSNPPGAWTLRFWIAAILVAGIVLSFYLLRDGRFYLVKLLESYDFLRPLLKFFRIMSAYSLHEMRLLLLYAFLRYCVFTLQFILILWLVGVPLPVHEMIAGVAVVFMLKSLIPAFNFLSDLGVREFSALLVFSLYSVPETQVILASLLVWSLNILLPALAGGINVLRLRLNPMPC